MLSITRPDALGYNYEDSATMGFHCTGRNFELAIAIALTAFAAMPMVAVSTVVGPLIEIPVMLGHRMAVIEKETPD